MGEKAASYRIALVVAAVPFARRRLQQRRRRRTLDENARRAAYSSWSPPDLFLSDYDVDPSFAGPRSLSFFSPGPLPFRYHASYLWLRDGVLFGDSGFFVGSGLP